MIKDGIFLVLSLYQLGCLHLYCYFHNVSADMSSGLLQVINREKKRIPNKDNYKFGTDPTMEDQIRRTNNWIHKTKKSILVALRGLWRSG